MTKIDDELKLVTGGIGEENYKYSYRKNDYVFIVPDGKERFVVDENIDTNDDGYIVTGHKSTLGVKERDVRESTMTASTINSCYERNGGRLYAMN